MQARRLREKLESYVADHPDFELKKMLLSGSLAKGTALRSLNDIDVAVYISGPDTPNDTQGLLAYLAGKLRSAYPNFSADQVQPQTYSVTVNFRGSGLNVDVVPVLYAGLPDWRGNLVNQDDGSKMETSIPLHLEFTRKRKQAQPVHFAQAVRLVKYWARRMKQGHHEFRFKSFMIEMILAKLVDEGVDLSDYPEALQSFFTYVAKSGLSDSVIFEDHYKATDVAMMQDPVQIIDPINANNNVARLYTAQNARMIVAAALDAGDAIDAALSAPTKELTLHYWQQVFGSTFQGK